MGLGCHFKINSLIQIVSDFIFILLYRPNLLVRGSLKFNIVSQTIGNHIMCMDIDHIQWTHVWDKGRLIIKYNKQ